MKGAGGEGWLKGHGNSKQRYRGIVKKTVVGSCTYYANMLHLSCNHNRQGPSGSRDRCQPLIINVSSGKSRPGCSALRHRDQHLFSHYSVTITALPAPHPPISRTCSSSVDLHLYIRSGLWLVLCQMVLCNMRDFPALICCLSVINPTGIGLRLVACFPENLPAFRPWLRDCVLCFLMDNTS